MSPYPDYRALCAALITAVDDASDAVDLISDCLDPETFADQIQEACDLIGGTNDLVNEVRTVLEHDNATDDLIIQTPSVGHIFRLAGIIHEVSQIGAGDSIDLARAILEHPQSRWVPRTSAPASSDTGSMSLGTNTPSTSGPQS
jgi:hypothetical protein